MKKQSPSINLISPEQRKLAIESIIDYFVTERNEEIGIIAAESLLDMFLERIGPAVFNSGVKSSQNLISTKQQETNFELELLLKE